MRAEAQKKLKYHVSVAMRQIREDLNERVKREVGAHHCYTMWPPAARTPAHVPQVKTHASVQRASIEDAADGHVLRVCSASTGTENYARTLSSADVAKCAAARNLVTMKAWPYCGSRRRNP